MITRDAVDLDRRFEEAPRGRVARRQPDGGWLFVMDMPLRTAAPDRMPREMTQHTTG
jgi:hypothetical protein